MCFIITYLHHNIREAAELEPIERTAETCESQTPGVRDFVGCTSVDVGLSMIFESALRGLILTQIQRPSTRRMNYSDRGRDLHAVSQRPSLSTRRFARLQLTRRDDALCACICFHSGDVGCVYSSGGDLLLYGYFHTGTTPPQNYYHGRTILPSNFSADSPESWDGGHSTTRTNIVFQTALRWWAMMPSSRSTFSRSEKGRYGLRKWKN